MAACSKHEDQEQKQMPLSFEWEHTVRKEGECSGESSPCLTVDLKYPVAVGGSDTTREAVNTYMDTTVRGVLSGFVEDTTGASADLLISRLAKQHSQTVQEYPEAPSQWSVEMATTVSRNDSAVICLRTETYSYLGGAHPLTTVHYTPFFAATGRQIAPGDIVRDKKHLLVLAEKAFRREREIASDTNLDSVGFWFGEQGFDVSDNLGFTDSTLVFYYNPYDIAPYVFGPTTIELPYAELHGIIDERVLRK